MRHKVHSHKENVVNDIVDQVFFMYVKTVHSLSCLIRNLLTFGRKRAL